MPTLEELDQMFNDKQTIVLIDVDEFLEGGKTLLVPSMYPEPDRIVASVADIQYAVDTDYRLGEFYGRETLHGPDHWLRTFKLRVKEGVYQFNSSTRKFVHIGD